MAEYTPPIEASLEEVELLRWLIEHAKEFKENWEQFRPLFESLQRASATAAGESNRINNRVEEIAGFVSVTQGLPGGGLTGQVVTPTRPDGRRAWRYLTHALAASYYVYLETGNPSWEMTGGVADDGTSPEIQFDDDGRTMLPIDDEASNSAAYLALTVYVTPQFDGEEFDIFLPAYDNLFGATTGGYSFILENLGAYDAVVNIRDTKLFYSGTSVEVRGGATWTVSPGLVGAWHVLNVWTMGTAVFPATDETGTVLDQWYVDNVQTPTGADLAELIRDTIGAALVAGAGISITVNDTDNTILITNTGGGGPTSGYGAGVYGGLPTYGG